MQATALAKQNEFLKGYIVRLQRQLEDYLGSYLPPPSSTSEREAEQLPPWIGDTTSLSPLLEAYDRRIAEADAAYESLSSQQAAIQARTRPTNSQRLPAIACKPGRCVLVSTLNCWPLGCRPGEACVTN